MGHHAQPRFTFARYWLPLLLYVALIFILSSMPRLQSPIRFPESDKVIHIGEYGILGWLLVRALRTLPGLRGLLAAGLLAVAIGVAVGSADEVFQRGVPGREPSVLDVIADALGLSLALIAYAWTRRWRDAAAPPGSGRAAA